MRVKRIEFRLDKLEQKTLKSVSQKYGLSLSDYIRRKIFNENEDLAEQGIQYVAPATDKHRLLNTSICYKLVYLVKKVLAKQGHQQEEILKLEHQALEYARTQREQHGYKVLMVQTEANVDE